MRQRLIFLPGRLMAGMLIAIGAAATIGLAYATSGGHRSQLPAEKYALADVKRTDLFPALSAGGRLESSQRTVVECELENITIGLMGERLYAGGSSVLLDIVPEGTMVHKGDTLAVLDASEYEELLRQQKMTVERSRADFRQAELNHEIATLAVKEYRDGLMVEAVNDFKRRVALAESDLVRIKDRLDWVRRMKLKGYAPAGQVTNEEFNQARALFNLSQERGEFKLFSRWLAPHEIKNLEVDVLGAEATLTYQRSRLNRNLDRLQKLEKQVELCTIRAPHDGFVIYANDERREIRIETGMWVRQKQDLLYLPDLNDMEVVASLHESTLREVAKGMRARVIVEGLPNRRLEGFVTDIASIPTYNWRSDVRYFDCKVKLNHSPRGIRPGMTAQVEIALDRRDQVLAVPVGAVTHEEGRDVCYVAHDDSLERREVKLGEGTADLLEISKGLNEGEQVVLNPIPSEVEKDTSEDSPLVSEPTLADNDLPALVTAEPAREIAVSR
jgi:HlyD family secretion protein